MKKGYLFCLNGLVHLFVSAPKGIKFLLATCKYDKSYHLPDPKISAKIKGIACGAERAQITLGFTFHAISTNCMQRRSCFAILL
jgi:hypothetical protein